METPSCANIRVASALSSIRSPQEWAGCAVQSGMAADYYVKEQGEVRQMQGWDQDSMDHNVNGVSGD